MLDPDNVKNRKRCSMENSSLYWLFPVSPRGQSWLHFSLKIYLKTSSLIRCYHGELFQSFTDGTALTPHPVLPLLIIPTSRLVTIQQHRSRNSEEPSHTTIQRYLIIQITSYSGDPCSDWALVCRFQKFIFLIFLWYTAFYSLFFIQCSIPRQQRLSEDRFNSSTLKRLVALQILNVV